MQNSSWRTKTVYGNPDDYKGLHNFPQVQPCKLCVDVKGGEGKCWLAEDLIPDLHDCALFAASVCMICVGMLFSLLCLIWFTVVLFSFQALQQRLIALSGSYTWIALARVDLFAARTCFEKALMVERWVFVMRDYVVTEYNWKSIMQYSLLFYVNGNILLQNNVFALHQLIWGKLSSVHMCIRASFNCS